MTPSALLVVLLGGLSLAAPAEPAAFVSAAPVWAEGRETEINLQMGFRAVLDLSAEQAQAADLALRATGSTLYRCFVNGEFLGYGPARAGRGQYRVDAWPLAGRVRAGRNVVAVEVAGYNTNSYYVLDQPSFLQAEVVAGGRALAWTGADGAGGFPGAVITERAQKVQRYSFQRPQIEVWRLAPETFAWRADPDAAFAPVKCAALAPRPLLPRGVPYPKFTVHPAEKVCAWGVMGPHEPKNYWKDRSLVNIGPELKGYPENELETVPSMDLQRLKTEKLEPKDEAGAVIRLDAGSFAIADLGVNLSGFPRMKVRCARPARLYVLFDEALTRGDVDWKRLGCVNALTFDLQPGDHALEGFEAHTMRYMKLYSPDGGVEIGDYGLRLYQNDDTDRASFLASDPRLNELFEAARTTFAQNAVDVFMDCPHRERAGWLCDSFFTSRTALVLSGDTRVERNFLENFLLADSFPHLPQGMLPMCYPADHNDGVFIPNWAMWFVVQLGEYLDRSGDRALVDALQPRVTALLDYFKPFENADGLLEKLESWVFVEWSAANDFVQDVNYPSNMLYAGVLDTAARLYGRDDLRDKAAALRETIRKQSLKNGLFYSDNALRKDGALTVTDNTTEVCQYFAFYFGVATPERDAELWRVLLDEFGPDRVKQGGHRSVPPANSFIGNMLRMELLSRAGRSRQIMDESIGYLKYMADRTGTLWENVQDNASLNHGFASHAAVTFYRDILGLRRVDAVNKTVDILIPDVPLERCAGTVPAGADIVQLTWLRDGKKVRHTVNAPAGWTVNLALAAGLEEEK
ncbi:MAG TPA: hypothetical protein PLI98_11910 [Candidatus Hydrogenedentes bacterium]|nr:hypothetical protein [Candidatus Hydrogenedentota bacterium]